MRPQGHIPVFQPLLEAEEFDQCRAALEDGWLGMGAYVGTFEETFERFLELEDRYVAAVSTGHAALHLALLLMNVGPGDEVVTPAFNNIADFQAILATGAEIVFCDIDDETLCLDVSQASELAGPRTKAIIATDYGCNLADHRALEAVAHTHGVRILHDAAHSLGSTHEGRPVGSTSDIAIFSFDPVKTITCIDGGLVVVRTEEELTQLHEMRLIGMGQPTSVMYQNKRAWTYDVNRLGFRYHMANLHAALGLAQLKKFDTISSNRRLYFNHFYEEFSSLPFLRVPGPIDETITPFMFYVRVLYGERKRFTDHLARQGVDTGLHWQPGHRFSAFQTSKQGPLAVTEKAVQEIVTLPLHSKMSEETRERIVRAVKSFRPE